MAANNTERMIELLAPARDFQSARTAIDYGADAVYIGGPRFGARHAAANGLEDIVRTVEYAHRFGARVHCTLNTLLFEDELHDAETLARKIVEAGVDALIVQDMAFLRMDLPEVELHASTQMCNMDPQWARFLEECGFSRIILERALSREQIREIRKACSVELECFVHGAICVSHSGRCMLSRTMSCRSGNRGECSQPCRLPYDLIDERGRVVMAGKHLLSVRDLNLSSHIGEMIDDGITSFKIEGRLKDISYVKNVVAYYRRKIDEAIASRSDCRRASSGESIFDFTPDTSKSFTRGESGYFFEGKRAGVASFDTPKSVGERIGRIVRVGRDRFTLDRDTTLVAGDGICLMGGKGVSGTNVNGVEGRTVIPNRMDGVVRGAEVFRNLDNRFRLMLDRSRTRRVIPARCEISFGDGTLSMRYIDCDGLTGEASLNETFDDAADPERMVSTLREQAIRSGDSIFRIDGVEISGNVRFVPVSKLSVLRREALGRLDEARRGICHKPHRRPENPEARLPETQLDSSWNVTNSLAEAFYRQHGARTIATGADLHPDLHGERVMRSSYCIRREIGQCLLERPTLRGELYLRHGQYRYRLEFDCGRCEMNLIYENN